MSDPRNAHDGQQRCQARGRRRPDRGENGGPVGASPGTCARSAGACPTPTTRRSADWFVLYWRQHGARLFAG